MSTISVAASAAEPDLAAPPADRGSGRPAGRRAWVYSAIGVLLLAVMLFPLYWMLNVSLQNAGSATATDLFPWHINLAGYRTALHDQGGHLLTSLVIALGSVALCLVVATPAAYALAQFRIRWAPVALFAILISQMIPGIVVANALYTAYNDLHLLNNYLGLILADSTAGIPFAILIVRAFMLNIPASVVEAARVDGAGQVRAFVSIVLPMSRNALITAGLFTFLFTWSDFLFALTLTTTDTMRPITLGIYQYLGSYISSWSAVMASAILACLPALVLLLVAQRFVAAGATGGAVK